MKEKWIERISIDSQWDSDIRNANNEICVELKKDLPQERVCFLWARIEDRSGREMDAIFPLPIERDSYRMTFCMQVSDPVLWNAENSYCYRLVAEIRDEAGKILESAEDWLAFYHWEVKDGDNLLNGKKVNFRSRKLPLDMDSEEKMDRFLKAMKHEFCNTLVLESEQECEFLSRKCMLYGIYLLAPGKHLDYGRIRAIMEQYPQGDHFEQNPDFSIHVIKNGALIENRSTFVNTSDYQLIFEVRKGEACIQKGKIHVDIPAGESRYVNLPYMELRDAGEFVYQVSLCLEEGCSWEEEGYAIASGENHIANLFL